MKALRLLSITIAALTAGLLMAACNAGTATPTSAPASPTNPPATQASNPTATTAATSMPEMTATQETMPTATPETTATQEMSGSATPEATATEQASSGNNTTANASTTPSPEVVVTDSQNGDNVSVDVGQSLYLMLGDKYQWSNVTVGDTSILGTIPDVVPVKGVQGVFLAKVTGSVTVTATGVPTCRTDPSPCSDPNQNFQVQVTVR